MSDQNFPHRENTRSIRGFIIFSIFNTILAASHILAPHMNIFFWEIRFKAFARSLHGFLEFVVYMVNLFSGGSTPLRMFIGLSLLGPLVGYGIQKAWQSGGQGKTIVLGCLLINTLFGTIAVYDTSLLVDKPSENCFASIDTSNTVQVVVFPEIGLAPGANYFFASSHDGGNTWEQVFYLHSDQKIAPPCGNFSSLDSQTYWFWMGWKFAVTHDGGNTWNVWEPSQTWEDWTCCEENLIINISFEDQQNGIMQISEFNNPTRTKQLLTEDGGIHWIIFP